MEIGEKYLPIGSVVLLKGGTKKVMITGYCMKTKENPDKIYDYSGCPFPEGVVKSTLTSVFNHNQIVQVFFIGYKNDESDSFLSTIKSKIEEYENNNQENQ